MNVAPPSKSTLRSLIRAQRAAKEIDTNLASNLLVELAELCIANGAKRVACYLPFGDEPDVELFLDWALEIGMEVLLPVAVQDGTLNWVIYDGSTQLGIFGFAEASGVETNPENVDLAIIPAMAVSMDGVRLGKGKGFYDRSLPTFDPKPPVVAVVFEDEVLDQIPSEEHDFPLDAVVTPGGTTRFSEELK